MTKHYTIHISGRVQAVSFRYNAKAEADKLGLFGFVRNEPDASVLIEAEGAENKLKEFVAWCKDGPRWARVTEANVTDGPVVGYLNFEIK